MPTSPNGLSFINRIRLIKRCTHYKHAHIFSNRATLGQYWTCPRSSSSIIWKVRTLNGTLVTLSPEIQTMEAEFPVILNVNVVWAKNKTLLFKKGNFGVCFFTSVTYLSLTEAVCPRGLVRNKDRMVMRCQLCVLLLAFGFVKFSFLSKCKRKL
jgi:hypothetical protein